MSDFLQALLGTMEQGACLIDSAGRIVGWNRAAERLTGFGPEEALGADPCQLLHHPAGCPDCPSRLARQQQEEVRRSDQLIRLKSGETLVVEVAAAPAPPDGTLELFWAPASDLALLTAVTHELRSPLGSIMGFARLAEHPRYGEISPHKLEFVQKINRSAQTMALTVANVALAASLAKGLKPALEDLELDGLVKEMVELFASDLAHKQASLVAPPTGLTVRADPALLRQVLFNLLANAVRNTDRGSVEVKAALKGGRVELEVADTGRGISEAEQSRVVRRFSHLHGQRRGIGLGLYVTQAVVRAHGSALELTSQPQQGTQVRFRLEGGPLSEPTVEPLRLVVAGPAPELIAKLEAGGHQVVRADLGLEALHQVAASRAQLVFCSGPLPDMEAGDLRTALRENPATRELPVVLVGDGPGSDFSATLPREAPPPLLAQVLSLAGARS